MLNACSAAPASFEGRFIAPLQAKIFRQVGTGLALSFLAISGHCQVFVGMAQSNGSVVLSNFQSQDAPQLLLARRDSGGVEVGVGIAEPVKAKLGYSVLNLPARADPFRGVIENVAQTVDIAPQLIHAVISAESNYNARAVSPKGAVGLMQLMPATASRFGVKDPFVIQDNVLGGASYLKWLMGYFKGNIELVLAAYNAGENAVVRAGHKVPNYPETQAYVRRIMADLRSTNSLPL